jgi:hypothetical protein
MLIHTTHILAVPVMIILWTIDVWIFLMAIRPILSILPYPVCTQLSHNLHLLSDPIVFRLNRWMRTRLHRSTPAWAGHALLLAIFVLIHHLLIWLILSL